MKTPRAVDEIQTPVRADAAGGTMAPLSPRQAPSHNTEFIGKCETVGFVL